MHKHEVELNYKIGIISISTSRSKRYGELRGIDKIGDFDESSKIVYETFKENVVNYVLIPDDVDKIRKAISEVLRDADVCITIGGTGISPSDVTIEAVKPMFTKELEGFGEIFRMLSYKEYVDKLVKAGVNEFVPAIHAHTAELHDYITQVKGSFNETYQAIKNIREYDVYLITNTVLSKLNYKVLPEIARMVIDLKVDQFQFACVHPLGNAWNYYDEVVPNFSEIQPYVHKAIDIGKEANVDVRVEAIPFCFMQGYEKYVSELYLPKYVELRDIGKTIKDFATVRKNSGKKKSPLCKNCKYDLICEGPWKEYPERQGFGELKPVEGEKITDVRELM